MVETSAYRASAALEIAPLTGHIGAEIYGVGLAQPLGSETVRAIRDALLRWKVVFLRDQPLNHDQHLAFARRLGEPTIGHFAFGHVEGYPEIYSVSMRRTANRVGTGERAGRIWTGWHSDVTTAINPPAISLLRAVSVPPYGGDTRWTNLVAAYNGLSDVMRDFVDTLRGIHRFTPPKVDAVSVDPNLVRQITEQISEHPLVRVHPETNERALYVCPQFLKSIVGLAPRESEQLLKFLWEHSVREDYTVRFRWRPGDLAIWDNRATCHLAPNDVLRAGFDRQLYRITLLGDIPVGVDDIQSTSLGGAPLAAWAAP